MASKMSQNKGKINNVFATLTSLHLLRSPPMPIPLHIHVLMTSTKVLLTQFHKKIFPDNPQVASTV